MVVGEDITLFVENKTGAGRGTVAIFLNDIIEGLKEILERVAQAIALQLAHARSYVDADDGRLHFLYGTDDGCAPRGGNGVGAGRSI